MKRLFIAVAALALIASTPNLGHARGEGWTDVMWGSIFGTSFGAVLGGISLVIYPSQAESDAHIYNIAIGAGVGLAAGVTYGAIIGWPKTEHNKTQLIIIPALIDDSQTTFVGLRKEF